MLNLNPTDAIDFASLKSALNAASNKFSEAHQQRLHRALVWLQKTEQSDDSRTQFIYLWLSFNAAYTHDFGSRGLTETVKFADFLKKLNDCDRQGNLQQRVWAKNASDIQHLLTDPESFRGYWDKDSNWQQSFDSANNNAQIALINNQTRIMLSTLMSRLYVLRNIEIHGAKAGQRISDGMVVVGTSILKDIVLVGLKIMLENAQVFDAKNTQDQTYDSQNFISYS